MKHAIKLKVVAVSTTSNSFGLRGHVLIGRSGVAVELGLNYLNSLSRGQVVSIPVSKSDVKSKDAFAYAVSRRLGGELSRPLPRAPKKVALSVWA